MKWLKTAMVIVGALVVTALGIDAADTLTGKEGTLLSSIIAPTRIHGCGDGMVTVSAVPGVSCVDIYEASPGKGCPNQDPGNSVETYKNAETRACEPTSEAKRIPWTFVTREQALQLCARIGKRLPTNAEWYALTLGMANVEATCNVEGGSVAPTGRHVECVAPVGTYDTIGNVWEWVSDDVLDGSYNDRSLPSTGYVTQVDNAGVAQETKELEDELFGKDYFWSAPSGAFGMIRGGFYGSGKDAGLYTVHADTPTNSASAGIGFRCVK